MAFLVEGSPLTVAGAAPVSNRIPFWLNRELTIEHTFTTSLPTAGALRRQAGGPSPGRDMLDHDQLTDR